MPYRYTKLCDDSDKDNNMPSFIHQDYQTDMTSGFIHQDFLNEEADSENENAISRVEDEVHDKITAQKQSVYRVLGYPISIPFIISNEFCERFSYYGMRTVLMIYLTEKLMMGNDEATNWYHEFVALCFATPLLGALIADVFIGKFLTILILSLVYLSGNAVMALTSVGKWFPESVSIDQDTGETSYRPQVWGPLLGLHLIALGTGGIKPCVSSFGGDQFLMSESARIQRYFSMFYFSINSGALAATFLTPELRSLSCMGEATCFPLAFGIPAVFMIFAVIAFVAASSWYVKVPPMGNPIIDVCRVTWAMVFKKDSLSKAFGKKKVEETKQLWRVLTVFIPLPFFWALYEQQGSRWIIQANRMNGKLGSVEIKPDQMQVVNPLLVLCLIPFFETVVYPLFKAIGLPTGATFRLISGMLLIAVAFVICGFVELAMEGKVAAWNAANPGDFKTLDTLERSEQIHILVTLPQIFVITCAEIMCSITGLEFAYAYAPTSMKSVCQSFFLLTNAFGNVLTIILTKVSRRDLILYFMWAGIQIFASILMFLICKKVQKPLDHFKAMQEENLKDEAIVFDDIALEETRPDSREIE